MCVGIFAADASQDSRELSDSPFNQIRAHPRLIKGCCRHRASDDDFLVVERVNCQRRQAWFGRWAISKRAGALTTVSADATSSCWGYFWWRTWWIWFDTFYSTPRLYERLSRWFWKSLARPRGGMLNTFLPATMLKVCNWQIKRAWCLKFIPPNTSVIQILCCLNTFKREESICNSLKQVPLHLLRQFRLRMGGSLVSNKSFHFISHLDV